MGLKVSFFVILGNDNPYKLTSSNSPGPIKVIIGLHPTLFVVTSAGEELSPATTAKTTPLANVTVGCAPYPE